MLMEKKPVNEDSSTSDVWNGIGDSIYFDYLDV